MKVVTLEALEQKKYIDPAATFKAIALAGGFGDVSPLHTGGLDIEGIEDKDAKAAIEKILRDGLTAKQAATPAANASN